MKAMGDTDMNDMTPAPAGHNNPPSPIDDITGQYEDERSEAENWLDGTPVTSEGQMTAVDALRKSMRECRLTLEKGQKAATAPLLEALNAERERWKPEIEDTKRIEGGLVALVDGYKRKLAAEKAAAEKAAWEAANKARREAEAKAAAANAADIEAQREAEEAKRQAMEAEKAAQAARKDTVKGLRKVTRYEVTDYKALLHWLAANRKDDVIAFMDEWARKNHKTERQAEGLNVWDDKEAY